VLAADVNLPEGVLDNLRCLQDDLIEERVFTAGNSGDRSSINRVGRRASLGLDAAARVVEALGGDLDVGQRADGTGGITGGGVSMGGIKRAGRRDSDRDSRHGGGKTDMVNSERKRKATRPRQCRGPVSRDQIGARGGARER